MYRDYPWGVRASRLVGLLGLLQARGRMSAGELARELEVSPRTIVRDIEALSSAGVPVYASRGRLGGFELLDGFTSDLLSTRYRPPPPAAGGVRRARLLLSPRGRRLAAVLGRPAGLRLRRRSPLTPGREDWAEAWMRVESPDAAVLDILALGAEAEVVEPPELRAQVADTAARIADLHRGGPARPGGPE
jgi:predicted DNA-binding transcriptional regulator YafY